MRLSKLFVAAAVTTLSLSAVAGSNPYERDAKKELRSCLNDVREPGYEIVAQTQVISACFAGGFITDVELFMVPTCHGQDPCPRPNAQLVGAVQFGCDDSVVYAECFAAPQYCYEIYAPVCGTDGQTYSNDCYADLAGTDIDYSGACDEPTSY